MCSSCLEGKSQKEKENKEKEWRYLIEIILAVLNATGNPNKYLEREDEEREEKGPYCFFSPQIKVKKVCFQRWSKTLPGCS